MVEPYNQIVLCAYCALVGICFGAIYHVVGYFKKWAKNNVFISFSLDFITFFFAGLALFLVFLRLNYAQIAVFGLVCFALSFAMVRVSCGFLFDLFISIFIGIINKIKNKFKNKNINFNLNEDKSNS